MYACMCTDERFLLCMCQADHGTACMYYQVSYRHIDTWYVLDACLDTIIEKKLYTLLASVDEDCIRVCE